MAQKRFLPLLLGLTFLVALGLFAVLLKPQAPATAVPEVEASVIETAMPKEPVDLPQVIEPEEITPEPIEPEIETIAALAANLQAIKDGKKSVLSVIFSAEDLNQQLTDLLELSESGEPWADYAIGQIAEMCNYLYKTPEAQLIQMFSGVSARARPEQQAQMSELMPVVVNASKRCKTLDKNQLDSLGESRDWFDKAAEAGNPSAFVISGYGIINERILADSDSYAEAEQTERWELGKALREQARQEYREQMRGYIADGKANPETLISMAEHLNLFYEDNHPYKSKEAWMLLACEQGYEEGCASSSMAMKVFCMFDDSCTSGGDFRQGVLWSQGQYKLDQYQRTADELKRIFETKDWDKLGF